MAEANGLPLDGLRILDLSTEITGPYATKLLADAGAHVIKLEPPTGDPLRRWSASHTPIAEGESGALFRFLNTSKQGAVAELESPAGRKLFLDLAAGVDIVVESLGAGRLEALGLGWDELHRLNPGLSLVSISPWGGTGPYAERPATEWTLQAASGATAFRGLPERGPVGAGGRVGEWCGSAYAATGALAAFFSARRTGRGQHVDLSLFESVLHSITIYHASINASFHPGPLRQALETPSIEPAKDGWVGFCAYSGQQWKDFCSMIGRPELAEGEKYFDQISRVKELPFVQQAMHEWTRKHSIDEIIEISSLLRIPCVPIGNGRTVLEMEHLRERGVYIDNPAGFKQPRAPYQMDHEPRALEPAPNLGEHQPQVEAQAASARPSLPDPTGEGALPFEGLRVVDLTAFWAGPTATNFLVQLGADVIKIESIQRPDGMRFLGTAPGENFYEWGPVFHGVNPGKRSVTLDLTQERGIAILRRLIEGADLLTENFSARVMENFGLTWETLHEWNPQLLVVRMPAFGLGGPWKDRAGWASSVDQVSGMAWVTGYEDFPIIVRAACDPIGGMHAAFAILLGLESRRRTKRGQLIEVPLVEPALTVAAEQVIEYTTTGEVLNASGNRGPYAAPQGIYPTADEKPLALAVATDAQWRALCELLGSPSWALDSRFDSQEGRRDAHDLIDAELSKWTSERSCSQLVDLLIKAGIPGSPVENGHSVRPHPQLEHRRFFQTLEHPITGRIDYPVLPMQFSEFGPELHQSPPPTLGQHNEEVLQGELGLTPDELEELREHQTIGSKPSFL
ncbi:MAG: CoA transferase [Deltaproteobacteria bacterium]|nr:CoA transferase [Deltaproteobacteria bacterium]